MTCPDPTQTTRPNPDRHLLADRDYLEQRPELGDNRFDWLLAVARVRREVSERARQACLDADTEA